MSIDSLLLQLRARESTRVLAPDGHASHHALPLGRFRQAAAASASSSSAPARRRYAPDSLDAASLCAQTLRSPANVALPQHLLLGSTGCVNAVAVSSEHDHGRWIASGGDDECVRLWDAYAPLRRVYAQPNRNVTRRAANSAPDDQSNSSLPFAGSIHEGPTLKYGGHTANIFGLQFTPDSRRILSCGLDARIFLHDVETGGGSGRVTVGGLISPLRCFTGHQSSVHRVSMVHGSNDVFLSASNDRTCRLFDARVSGGRAQSIGSFTYSVNSVHCSPTDEHMFVTAGKNLCLHDLRRMHNPSKPAAAAAASPATTRSATRATARARHLARTALALRRGQTIQEVEGAGSASNSNEEDEDEDEDDEPEFRSLLEIMMGAGPASSRDGATPMAVLQTYDLTTLTPPLKPATRATAPSSATAASTSAQGSGPRRSPRTAAATARAGSGRGGGAVTAARGSRGGGGSASRARGSRAGAAAASHSEDAQAATPSPATRSSRGGRGASRESAAAAASSSSSRRTRSSAAREQEAEEEEEKAGGEEDQAESERQAREEADSDAEQTEEIPWIQHVDEDDEDEEPSTYPTPNERRNARLSAANPPREAASCEFSSDGRFVLACMMKAQPLLFDISQATPVLSLQSRGAFAGYSNTCTMKSAVFAGPDERFIIAGSDTFGLYCWDRRQLANDVLGRSSSASSSASSSSSSATQETPATFLNACKIIRGHRSIPNNQKYLPQLGLLLSCGVEKVVRVFHCSSVLQPAPSPADLSADAAAMSDCDEERTRDLAPLPHGTLLSEREAARVAAAHHIPIDAPAAAAASSSSSSSSSSSAKDSLHKRKLDASSSQPEEKKARGSSNPRHAQANPRAPDLDDPKAVRVQHPPAPLDPLYRMVRTYMQPRVPFTRLQCAYTLSGGSAAFGAAASLFADAEEEVMGGAGASAVREDEVDNGRGSDSMAEDKTCLAQFDWYVSKAAAGGDSSEEEDDDDDDEDDDEIDEDADNSSEGVEATGGAFLDLDSDEERRMRQALSMEEEEEEDNDEEDAEEAEQ